MAWEGDGTYLLVVLFGPQGCPHVLGRGRVDGGAVLRAVVVALAHAWGSGKQRVTGGGLGHEASVRRPSGLTSC